jgi:hypothetical protein
MVRLISKCLQMRLFRGGPAREFRRRVPNGCPSTQTHQPTAPTKKTCKYRPFEKRLKVSGFTTIKKCLRAGMF